MFTGGFESDIQYSLSITCQLNYAKRTRDDFEGFAEGGFWLLGGGSALRGVGWSRDTAAALVVLHIKI